MYRFIGDFSEVKILRIVGRKPYNAVIAYKIGFVFAGILFGCKRYCFAVKCTVTVLPLRAFTFTTIVEPLG